MASQGGGNYKPVPLATTREVEQQSRRRHFTKAENAKIAAGKALSILMKMEAKGFCGVEKKSVYGAAVAMPQVARSAGWSRTLTGLAIRSWVFLMLNVMLQGYLISMIRKEAEVMNAFAGQMHLCDFGAALDKCPGAPTCTGPAGTEYTPSRLYSFDAWSTRTFVRDSLKVIFPDKAEEIDKKVDPGEYGLESYGCRMVCCFLFMMAVVDDFRQCLQLGTLLWSLPTEAATWISYTPPTWHRSKDYAKAMHGWTELDLVSFKVAGMPRFWKVVNVVFVLLPKICLWFCLTSAGFHFLMETAGIVDLTVNAMAMTFILSIDEMILSCLGTVATRYIVEHLEDYRLFDTEIEEQETEDATLERFEREEAMNSGMCMDYRLALVLFPKRLLLVLVLLAIFFTKYYHMNCYRSADGAFVSKDMYLPKSARGNPMEFLFGLPPEEDTEPFWTMPKTTVQHEG